VSEPMSPPPEPGEADVPRRQVLVGDAFVHLRELPPGSIDTVVTSPPYFLLRNYGTAGQLGLEAHVDEWASRLRDLARLVARVLVPTGTFWLNLGDTYATHISQGAPRKGLLLAPERVALVLSEDGWLVRNKIVWAKANHLPTSARDRLACSYEVIYLFVRQPRYFFNLDGIREPHRSRPPNRKPAGQRPRGREPWRGPNSDAVGGLPLMKARGMVGHPLGRNPGDVWRMSVSNYRGGHHATFPEQLARRMVQAGCPEARCVRCRAAWQRPVRRLGQVAVRGALTPGCTCGAAREPGMVLDPFIGAGTTAVVAEALDRDWLGIELNPIFAALTRQRVAAERQKRAADGAGDQENGMASG
jgi:site-specific DNA-methyltransferase (adenine-specific)